MQSELAYYAKKFAKLHVNRHRDRGPAPHKPILLLSVIELIEQGKIQRNRIYLSPELIATFLKYWTHFGSEKHRSNIALPFFHLQGDKFWHLMPNPGFEATVSSQSKLSGLNSLKDAIKYAYFDDALFHLLEESKTRQELIGILSDAWFKDKEQQISQLLQYDEFEDIQLKLFDSGGVVYSTEELKDDQRTFVRSAAFRKIVVSLYEQRCALCRLKIIVGNQTIVDGAHIMPFSEFRDDRFDNGLALCKNHHWAFDHGWFGISDRYQIVIPPDRFYEEAPNALQGLDEFNGEEILLPVDDKCKPRLEALSWHRNFWEIAS
ncbi:HNH endonuclease [Romeria aff. gracilis LEGE 07310]|uniref:HNH endonuclease n=1 Tax=Vasconcelosia minhoensis LEGE 07310 TaxID=915328 RepID=A0A8J7DCR2_9CYAN|nr:HNH endonuclease [Romeria gracilis]MBE9079162.1 HNH endonuclease [Romeria aff. gracilis LEGE 07310]